MKKVIGTIYRKEGKHGNRSFKVIECQECGAKTYERKQKQIDAALSRGCRSCNPKGNTDTQRANRASYRHDSRSKHPLYRTYEMMLIRCYNSNHKSYTDYGGRGIYVCTRWIVDFWAFVEDMGERPDGCSLDRINNSEPYHPNNCRWATPTEQARNRRSKFTLLTNEERKLQNSAKKMIYLRMHHKRTYIPVTKSWWLRLGCKRNPFIYGPMPWKRTSSNYRKAEAIELGIFTPSKK